MRPECLPLATPYDPAEDPPGSVDPLGTVTSAEQLADVLFVGMTARMWRARHLTFAALATLVSEQAVADGAGGEELRLEARLALERLFVSAIARQERGDKSWHRAARRLPGISLARRAFASDDQPLGRRSFLKGQAINGPFGVVARLARDLDLVDEYDRLSRGGRELLLAWAADQELEGLLDVDSSSADGAVWLRRLVDRVVAHAEELAWPPRHWQGWEDLAERLRPDAVGRRERHVLWRLMTADRSPVRRRVLQLLEQKDTVAAYRGLLAEGARGHVERRILVSQIQPRLDADEVAVDRTIQYVIHLIEAYEQVGGCLESVFRSLLWGLTHRNGQATPAVLLADPVLSRHVSAIRRKLISAKRRLAAKLADVNQYAEVLGIVESSRLSQLLDDAEAATVGEPELIERVLARHGRVQQQKGKGVWIERDPRCLILLPGGFGDSEEFPRRFDGSYIHPFRVTNAFSFLSDLRRIPTVEVRDAEEA